MRSEYAVSILVHVEKALAIGHPVKISIRRFFNGSAPHAAQRAILHHLHTGQRQPLLCSPSACTHRSAAIPSFWCFTHSQHNMDSDEDQPITIARRPHQQPQQPVVAAAAVAPPTVKPEVKQEQHPAAKAENHPPKQHVQQPKPAAEPVKQEVKQEPKPAADKEAGASSSDDEDDMPLVARKGGGSQVMTATASHAPRPAMQHH